MSRRWHRDDWDDFAGMDRILVFVAAALLVSFLVGTCVGRTSVSQLPGYNEHLLRRAARY